MERSNGTHGPTVVRGGRLIDGTGAAPHEAGVVVIEEGKISAVGPEGDFDGRDWTGYTVIDAEGGTILPGLINCHEHLEVRHGYGSYQERAGQTIDWGYMRAARNALLALQEGLTTVRDVGSKGILNLTLRQAIEEGMIVGPRVVACGQPLAMTGGHGQGLCMIADGVDQVRAAAREQLLHGADLIKCMASGGYISKGIDQPESPQFTVEELRAAFDEAHSAGKLTTVHAHPPTAIRNAIEAGVDCIEHAALVDEPTAELLADRNIPVVPTLVEHWDMAEHGLEWGRPAWLVEHARGDREQRLMIYSRLVAAGCKLAVGTDVMGSIAREIELMAEGGLDNMAVLVAATRNGADVCGLGDRTGTLEAGKDADVLVVAGDPLEDLDALRHVQVVLKQGAAYRPASLAAATGRVPL
jgi:imidazolonepropionase-like amidohydrolase